MPTPKGKKKEVKKKAAATSEVEVGEYKGNQTLTIYRLKDGERQNYPFGFGKGKAKLIVEHYDAIKEFAESDD